MALRVRRTKGGPCQPSGGSHLLFLENHALQEGGEARGGEGRDLFCQRVIPVSPYGATLLLESAYKISEVIQMLFHPLAGLAPPFDETFNWLQFSYTTDQTGAYVAPAPTVMAQSVVSDRYDLSP